MRLVERLVSGLVLPLTLCWLSTGGLVAGCAKGTPDVNETCGNGALDEGEQCDDGGRLDGDGCSAGCHVESLYPGFTGVKDGRLLVWDEPKLLMGAAGLPVDTTDVDALGAGFNFLVGSGTGGLRARYLEQSGTDLAAFVGESVDQSNLIAWVGPDEPLWNGITATEVESEYVLPLAEADPYGRLFWLNHAPRGSQAQPTELGLLAPYLKLTDVVSMDIYPVPEGNGHSALPEHPGLTAVGAYTQMLAGLVAASGRDQALVMVLQGVGLGHIPDERWEMVEQWQTDGALDFVDVRFGAVGDFDGDGVDEVVLGVAAEGGPSRLVMYDFVDSPWGGRAWEQGLPTDVDLSKAWRVTSGDYDGNGTHDLLMSLDVGPGQQEFWSLTGDASGFGEPALVFSLDATTFDLSVMHHVVSADYTGDGCDDVIFSYDYPGPNDQAWFVLTSGCAGYPVGYAGDILQWRVTSTAELDLERVVHAAASDVDGDGLGDLVLAYDALAGPQQVLVLVTDGTTFAPTEVVFEDSVAQLAWADVVHFGVADFDGDGAPEMVLDHAPAGGSSRMLFGELDGASLTAAELDPWLTVDAQEEIGALAGIGDLDGDGTADLVFGRPAVEVGVSLSMAFSTGRFFGARDPLPAELWFMAADALIRGATGVVFWGQSFVHADHVAWQRLTAVVGELSLLHRTLEGEPLARQEQGDFAWWWIDSGDAGVLVVAHESRASAGTLPGVPVPAEVAGTLAYLWSGVDFVAAPGVSASGSLLDPEPFGPYEIRIYEIRQ
jgi:cysteine-rich repeat protein